MTKTALVSGGTSGIGEGASIQLLEDGFNVVAFSRKKEHCDALREKLGNEFDKGRFLVVEGDVTDEASLTSVVAETIETFSTIDVLVNNAGVGYFAAADDLDIKKFKEMLDTNVVGMAILTDLVVPHMKRQKSGLIVNIASISGKRAFPMGEYYSATKFGVMGYSEAIRKELKEFGIKVSTICPGMIQTSFFDEKELKRRMKQWGGEAPTMLDVSDISRIIGLICAQSDVSDIQDITVMPFDS